MKNTKVRSKEKVSHGKTLHKRNEQKQQTLTFHRAKLPLKTENACGAQAAYTREAVASNLKLSGLINWCSKIPDANKVLKFLD